MATEKEVLMVNRELIAKLTMTSIAFSELSGLTITQFGGSRLGN